MSSRRETRHSDGLEQARACTPRCRSDNDSLMEHSTKPADAALRARQAHKRAPERDKFYDFREFLPKVGMRTIFDVGANVGRTATQFREHYPDAAIWAFEPVKATFGELQT